MEIANLLDAEFKTLVIRMLRELEYSKQTNKQTNEEEEMKVTLSKIKKNPQRTNSEGKEASIQSNDLENKEAISIQPEQQEEK